MANIGPLWMKMGARPRVSLNVLKRSDLPEQPGVYALYRDGERMYVGKATSLRQRVGGAHASRGASMTNSAMRRNVAEHLGISTAAAIKDRSYRPSAEDVVQVREWMDACELAWLTTDTPAAAKGLEDDFKDEFKPPLTKL